MPPKAPRLPARLWRQRPDIYRRIWGRHYGRKHWFSVKIGGTQRTGDLYVVKRGPQKGKSISGRYFFWINESADDHWEVIT